jgi:DNA-binding GntR family transcriptional regulator
MAPESRPETPQLVPLTNDSLRERARAVIRSSIVAGELRPGVLYTVGYFTERLGVSATPVREALGDLASEGLIRPLPKRGFTIPELSDLDLDELHQIRQLLEVPTVTGLAEAALQEPQLAEVARSARELVACAAKMDVQGLLSADRRFHLGLLKLVGNRRLVEVGSKLLDQQRMFRLPSDRASADELRESADRHARILDAIRSHDADTTRSLMVDHFVYARGRRAKSAGESAP